MTDFSSERTWKVEFLKYFQRFLGDTWFLCKCNEKDPIPERWRRFRDSAKVRFCCEVRLLISKNHFEYNSRCQFFLNSQINDFGSNFKLYMPFCQQDTRTELMINFSEIEITSDSNTF